MAECEYCEQYKDIIGTCPKPNEPILKKTLTSFFGEWVEISAQYWSDGLYLYWSNDRADHVLDKIHINYCPMCGRKLGDE